MNVLFFLTPKHQIEYVFEDFTLRQALEKMEHHRYTTIPILKRDGQYIGTLSEGDILRYIKNHTQLDIEKAEDVCIGPIERYRQYAAISINAAIEDLLEVSLNQNFIPIVDDRNMFIGIVKRKVILEYFYQQTNKQKTHL